MNTKALAQLYDRLTPWERLPLILAASARGDEAERDRLVRAAPKVGYRVPDHFGLAMAFREMADRHFMELLNLAALYFQSLALADALSGERDDHMLDTALLCGYLFQVQLAGWRQFCAEVHLEPEFCWSYCPGFDTLQRAEKQTEMASFTAEGVDAYLRRKGDQEPQIVTPDDIAARLQTCLKARADWWG